MMTPEQIAQKRMAIVDEARTWLGTPFHHEARVKGAGVDCGQLLAAIFEAVGLINPLHVNHYPMDFMLHRDEEWYLSIVMEHAIKIPEYPPPLPGDIVLCQIGRLFSHGGIIMDWPKIIHASVQDNRVIFGDLTRGPLAIKKRLLFRHKELANG